MNNRETKIFSTPEGNHKVVVNTFITFGENRQIRDIFLDEKLTDAEKYNKAQDLTFKTLIVSIDESTDDVVGKILSMSKVDGDFVAEQMTLITKGDDKKKVI